MPIFGLGLVYLCPLADVFACLNLRDCRAHTVLESHGVEQSKAVRGSASVSTQEQRSTEQQHITQSGDISVTATSTRNQDRTDQKYENAPQGEQVRGGEGRDLDRQPRRRHALLTETRSDSRSRRPVDAPGHEGHSGVERRLLP